MDGVFRVAALPRRRRSREPGVRRRHDRHPQFRLGGLPGAPAGGGAGARGGRRRARLPRALHHIIWAGANNFFFEITDPGAVVAAAAGDIAGTVGTLGAALDQVEAATGIRIMRFSAAALLGEIVADGAAFGFDNVTESCLAADFSSLCAEPDGRLFWDGVHPTTAAHAILADRIVETIWFRFESFDIRRLRVRLGRERKNDRGGELRIDGRLAAAADGNGLGLGTDDIIVGIGEFTRRIEADELERQGDEGRWRFRRHGSGITELAIRPDGRFRIKGKRIDVGAGAAISGSIRVCLQVGDDLGTADVPVTRRSRGRLGLR